jgi:phosphate acetyltransferase
MSGDVLSEGRDAGRVIEHVAIGAMQPRHVLERIGPGSLLIVPGDREDVIRAAVSAGRQGASGEGAFFGRSSTDSSRTDLAGLVLTGGYEPSARTMDTVRAAGLFCFLVAEDTYAAASEVHDLLVKTHADDVEKIELIKSITAEHLDTDRILARFAEPP